MIALHLAGANPAAAAVAAEFVSQAAARGLDVTGCTRDDAEALSVPVSEGAHRVVVAVGGDGTMLEGAACAIAADADVVGINVGRVGFLAEVERGDVSLLADVLASGDYAVKHRMTIRARVNGETVVGLNDVVIEKVASQQMITVDITVDEERFLSYRADGVIVSTPTGSSAYTLSAGGPLVDPRIDGFVITPVAAYSLFSASVVLHPAARLEATILHDRPAGCSVDGHVFATLTPGDSVHIDRGPALRLVDVSGRSYAETLRTKLRLQDGLSGIKGSDA